MLKLSGRYRDFISRDKDAVIDMGWESNTIAADCSMFLSAVLKKDLTESPGINYMAFGNSITKNEKEFKENVNKFIPSNVNGRLPKQPLMLHEHQQDWIWAKEIWPENMKYLDKDGKSTDDFSDTIRIDIMIKQGEPQFDGVLDFKEFALVGSGCKGDTRQIFLINYVDHSDKTISKDNMIEIKRIVDLKFDL